jgi:hypothetical protein
MAITSGNPKPKPTKKAYAKSHQEFIGNPAMQGGKTAKAKADLKKAIKGGAAKAANKLVKPSTKNVMRKGGAYAGTVDKIVVDPRTAEKKAMSQRIINDKSKTAMRAKIVEMKAVKKANKR